MYSGKLVFADQTIALDVVRTGRYDAKHLRLIRYKDAAYGKTLVLLTNHTGLTASTIGTTYRTLYRATTYGRFLEVSGKPLGVSRHDGRLGPAGMRERTTATGLGIPATVGRARRVGWRLSEGCRGTRQFGGGLENCR